MSYNQQKFIEVWNAAENRQEVAKRLKIKPQSASRRASLLRNSGEFMKYMYRDPAFFAAIGRIGGRAGTTEAGSVKGFASDDRTPIQKLLRKPKRAQWAGKRGGHNSKRGKAHAGL